MCTVCVCALSYWPYHIFEIQATLNAHSLSLGRICFAKACCRRGSEKIKKFGYVIQKLSWFFFSKNRSP